MIQYEHEHQQKIYLLFLLLLGIIREICHLLQ